MSLLPNAREIAAHNRMLAEMGKGRRKYTHDPQTDEKVYIKPFMKKLASSCRFSRRLDLTPHDCIPAAITMSPPFEDFGRVLWKVRNHVLVRAMRIARACAKRQVYRERFGTSWDYFQKKVEEIHQTHTRIFQKYQLVRDDESYLEVMQDMLDWYKPLERVMAKLPPDLQDP